MLLFKNLAPQTRTTLTNNSAPDEFFVTIARFNNLGNRPMCGIVGIYSHTPVAPELYDSLIHLQHRGQDAAGMLTFKERFYVKHGLGLVRETFSPEDIAQLHGTLGIGHTRYPTAGGYNIADVQPLWIGSPRGIGLAHNGNLVNYKELAHEITQQKHRHLNSSIDSEVLLHLLADGLDHKNYVEDDAEPFFKALCDSIQSIFNRVSGSYSAVSVIIGKGLVVDFHVFPWIIHSHPL